MTEGRSSSGTVPRVDGLSVALELETPTTCGACGRAFPTPRQSCLYCGWEPGHAEATYGATVDEATYRQGAILGRFVLSTALLTPLGLALWGESTALALMALLFGPGVLLVQIARRLRGAIETRQEGVVHAGELFAWGELESAELLSGIAGRQHPFGDLARFMPGRRGVVGVVGGLSGGRGVLGLLFAPFLFLYYVLVPAVALLTPWHTRVVLTRTRGDRLTLHDLQDAPRFVSAAQGKLLGPGAP